MLLELIITLALTLAVMISLFVKKRFTVNYWKKKGFVYDDKRSSKRKSEFDEIKDMYERHSESQYVCFYRKGKPRLLLRDPKLIKDILGKDFDKFESRGINSNENDVLSQNILFANGNKWRLLRSKLSPTFTSGKLKSMIPLITRCNNQFQDRVEERLICGDNNCATPPPSSSRSQPSLQNNFRTTISDYTTSVMTSVAFGIQSGTLENTDDTPFKEIGRSFFENNKKNHWFYKYFNSRFRVEDKKFIQIFKEVMKARERTPQQRPDFIDLCLKLKKECILKDPEAVGDFTINVTDELLAAQAFFFFLAGNDSAETVITFALYELAHNEPCLSRLHAEIDELMGKYGEPTYVCLEKAKYLERVIKETMRKYPPIGHLQRLCSEPYTLPDGKIIEPGIRCTVSVLALHRDENYYPEPLKFDPDRFLDSGLQNSDYFMPFGRGRRQCIGIRLGEMQLKMAFFALFTHFTVRPSLNDIYQKELELQDIFVALKPKDINVKFVRRSSH